MSIEKQVGREKPISRALISHTHTHTLAVLQSVNGLNWKKNWSVSTREVPLHYITREKTS